MLNARKKIVKEHVFGKCYALTLPVMRVVRLQWLGNAVAS